jgi:hypothetical protein
MSDALTDIVGAHVSRLPDAIEDVWPIVDASGTVVDLVRTWDDELYVCLDHTGHPVNDIAHTHHLMPRELFRAKVIPTDWSVVAVRRVSRGVSKTQSATAAVNDVFGDRQEFEVLTRLNAGEGILIDRIDTSPPYTHIVQLEGEFFLAHFRGDPQIATLHQQRQKPEPRSDSSTAAAAPAVAEATPVVATDAPARTAAGDLASATSAAAPEPSAAAPAISAPASPSAATPVSAADVTPAAAEAPGPPTDSPEATGLDIEKIAAVIKAALAGEAAAALLAPRAPAPPPLEAHVTHEEPVGPGPAAATLVAQRVTEEVASQSSDGPSPAAALLKAVEVNENAPTFVDDEEMGTGNVGLSSALAENMWDVRSAGKREDGRREPDAAALLVSEKHADADVRSARAASYAQAAAFVTAASTSLANVTGGVLTLEQVRKSGRFAWDEFMNLYLPHVGFVAAMPTRKRATGGDAAEVTFASRSEFDMRPIGWHHLADCDCTYCRH